MFTTDNMKQAFAVTSNLYNGGLTYSGNWATKGKANVWVWKPNSGAGDIPHLTTWDDDFNGNELIKFHITFTYNNLPGREVHVYYKVVGDGVKKTSVDANRCNSDAEKAKEYVSKNLTSLNTFALQCVQNAFPAA